MATQLDRWLGVTLFAFVAAACGDDATSTTGAGGGNGTGGSGTGGAASCVLTGQHPIPRGESMGVLDAARGRLVFFGGDTGVPKNCNPSPRPVGELWTYDVACRQFEQVPDGATGPSPRARGVAVLDTKADRMIMFGGRYRAGASGAYTLFNDVWALDLAKLEWTEIQTTGTAPSARSSTAAVYDEKTNELVVFGGNQSSSGLTFAPRNDVFAVDLGTGAWREITTTGPAPSARLFHSAAIDPTAHRLYVYGGGDANAFTGPFLRDLWSLDLDSGQWTEEDGGGAGSPGGRINSGVFFDTGKNRLVMFAGHDDGAVGNQNDTWTFDPSSKAWSALISPETVKTDPPAFCVFPPDFTVPNMNAPDRRSAYVGAQDVAGAKIYVYGGHTDCGNVDDVWSFDLAADAWTEDLGATIGEACIRGDNPDQCSTLCI